MKCSVGSLVLLLHSTSNAFTPLSRGTRAFAVSSVEQSFNSVQLQVETSSSIRSTSSTRQSRLDSWIILHAKKKKGNKAADAAMAALDALEDKFDDIQEEPLSLKEQKALEKKTNKDAKQAAAAAAQPAADAEPEQSQPKLNAKNAAMQKLLDMEAADADRAASEPEKDDTPKLSKKEQKKADKLAEKKMAKLAKKAAKKNAANLDDAEEGEDGNDDAVNGDATAVTAEVSQSRPSQVIYLYRAEPCNCVVCRCSIFTCLCRFTFIDVSFFQKLQTTGTNGACQKRQNDTRGQGQKGAPSSTDPRYGERTTGVCSTTFGRRWYLLSRTGSAQGCYLGRPNG